MRSHVRLAPPSSSLRRGCATRCACAICERSSTKATQPDKRGHFWPRVRLRAGEGVGRGAEAPGKLPKGSICRRLPRCSSFAAVACRCCLPTTTTDPSPSRPTSVRPPSFCLTVHSSTLLSPPVLAMLLQTRSRRGSVSSSPLQFCSRHQPAFLPFLPSPLPYSLATTRLTSLQERRAGRLPSSALARRSSSKRSPVAAQQQRARADCWRLFSASRPARPPPRPDP